MLRRPALRAPPPFFTVGTNARAQTLRAPAFLPVVLAETAPIALLALVLLAIVYAQASSLAAGAQCAPPA